MLQSVFVSLQPFAWRSARRSARLSRATLRRLALPLALLLALPALAERADRDRPLQIEANRLQHDEARQVTLIEGRITATKGSIVMRGERMEVRQDAQGRQSALLSAAPGERVFFRQKREGLDEFIEGQAERAEYDSARDVLTLRGQAVLRTVRADASVVNEVEGQVIVFNNSSETYSVDGRSDAGSARVRATIAPRSVTTAPSTHPPGSAPPAVPLRSSPRLQP